VSTSEEIRSLAREGIAVADIARRLGIAYQHAYGVLKNDQQRAAARPSKLPLTTDELVVSGFQLCARWILNELGELSAEGKIPSEVGVYAFAKDQAVLYVGLATIGLARRLYGYRRPGPGQLTNMRLNALLKGELSTQTRIEIYTATPTNLEWNGLPVHSSAGLELGLIEKYSLPWNKRGAG
jgi:hypothetical protein